VQQLLQSGPVPLKFGFEVDSCWCDAGRPQDSDNYSAPDLQAGTEPGLAGVVLVVPLNVMEVEGSSCGHSIGFAT